MTAPASYLLLSSELAVLIHECVFSNTGHCALIQTLQLVRSALAASILTFSLSIAMSAMALAISNYASVIMEPPETGFTLSPMDIFGVVFFAPLVETAVMAGMIAALNNWIKQPSTIAAVTAVIWGALHALASPLWFFGVIGPFFIFAKIFQSWRLRSPQKGYIVAALTHVLHNSYAVALTVFGL